VTDPRRPVSVAFVAGALFVLALISASIGMLVTSLSSCCGSGESSDGTYALIGLAVGGALSVAGIGLWFGSLSRRTLLGLTLPPLAVCALAADSSSDLGALLPLAALGWLAFVVYVYRPAVSLWLGR
jgi:hypothetical protein